MLLSLASLARRAVPSAARSFSEAPAAATRDSGTVVLFGSLTALTAGLCAWQLYRYQWKVSVLQERDALLNSPPLDISAGL
jgi:cytochrome oxidase assembly protein ShyY1